MVAVVKWWGAGGQAAWGARTHAAGVVKQFASAAEQVRGAAVWRAVGGVVRVRCRCDVRGVAGV